MLCHCAFERCIIPTFMIQFCSSLIHEKLNDRNFRFLKGIFERCLHPIFPTLFYAIHSCTRLSHLPKEKVAMPAGEIVPLALLFLIYMCPCFEQRGYLNHRSAPFLYLLFTIVLNGMILTEIEYSLLDLRILYPGHQ